MIPSAISRDQSSLCYRYIVTCFPNNWSSTSHWDMVTRDILFKIICMHRTPYHPWLARGPWTGQCGLKATDRNGEHPNTFPIPCQIKYPFLMMQGGPNCTSNHLHLCSSTSLFEFHQPLQTPLLVLVLHHGSMQRARPGGSGRQHAFKQLETSSAEHRTRHSGTRNMLTALGATVARLQEGQMSSRLRAKS